MYNREKVLNTSGFAAQFWISEEKKREEERHRGASSVLCQTLFPLSPHPLFSPSCAQPPGRRNFAKNKGWGVRGVWGGGRHFGDLDPQKPEKKMAVVRPTDTYTISTSLISLTVLPHPRHFLVDMKQLKSLRIDYELLHCASLWGSPGELIGTQETHA